MIDRGKPADLLQIDHGRRNAGKTEHVAYAEFLLGINRCDRLHSTFDAIEIEPGEFAQSGLTNRLAN